MFYPYGVKLQTKGDLTLLKMLLISLLKVNIVFFLYEVFPITCIVYVCVWYSFGLLHCHTLTKWECFVFPFLFISNHKLTAAYCFQITLNLIFSQFIFRLLTEELRKGLYHTEHSRDLSMVNLCWYFLLSLK